MLQTFKPLMVCGSMEVCGNCLFVSCQYMLYAGVLVLYELININIRGMDPKLASNIIHERRPNFQWVALTNPAV